MKFGVSEIILEFPKDVYSESLFKIVATRLVRSETDLVAVSHLRGVVGSAELLSVTCRRLSHLDYF